MFVISRTKKNVQLIDVKFGTMFESDTQGRSQEDMWESPPPQFEIKNALNVYNF